METVSEKTVICPVCCRCSYCNHGDPIYQEHHCRKDGKSEPSVRYYLIDLIGSAECSRVFLFIAGFDHFRDIYISLIGDDAFRIIIKFALGCLDIILYMSHLVSRYIHLLKHLIISLKYLYGIPSLLFLGHVMNDRFFDMRDRMLDRS